MHSKVIIASLVFGLSIGFAAVSGKTANVAKQKEDNMTYALQKQEEPTKKEAAKIPVIKEGGGTSHTHVYNYSYDYCNDAFHYANCACGTARTYQEHVFDAYYPYGHGHNDMIHCSLCNTNIWMDALRLDDVYTDSLTAQSGRWYYFYVEGSGGTFVFETTGNSDTYGELYLGNFPTTRTTYNDDGGANLNFRITRYIPGGTNVFLRVRGYSWGAASYSLTVSEYHEHDYSQIVDIDENNHQEICSICGATRLQPHAYNICSSYNSAYHTMRCACGRTLAKAEHTYCDYLPYGHGHNDMIRCSVCQNNIECARLEEGFSYSNSISADDAKWYVFIPQSTGTYIFETTGNYDTYGELYLGNYPTTRTTYNDDDGANRNFRISYDLEGGQPVFLRVRGYSWRAVSYSISVVMQEPEPEPDPSWTIMLYMCGLNTMSQMDEIESVTVQQPTDINIIVETDINRNTGSADNYLHRYYLRNGTFLPYGGGEGRVTKANMGLQSTFQNFLAWGVEEFEADKMGLILYNHGGGIKGVCFDDYGMSNGQDDSIRVSEIAAACANVFAANNIEKFEFIGYDACVMQVQDVAEFNSPYFNYQIASEEEESADMGWAYNEWIDDLFLRACTEDLIIEICETMTAAGCNCCPSWGLNLTALDLRKMSTYKAKFEQLAGAMYTAVNANRSEFYGVIESCYQFGTNASATQPWHNKGYGNFDAGRFFSNLKNNSVFGVFDSLIDQVEDAYEELVFCCSGYGFNGGSNPASGVSIQHLIYPEYHIYPAEETHFTNWRSLFPTA